MAPWLAMWTPNIVLTILGMIGLYRVRRESGSTRGGDFQEVLDGIRPPVAAAAASPAGGQPPGPEERVGMRAMSTLDRYVLGSWVRIFVLTALGLPIVSILINLTDTLNRLLDRGLTMREIAVSYVYSIPENMFLVMPAAVLLATVFTVGAMGRYSELTAAKAGGQSFHRLMLPVFAAAALASVLAFIVGELAPGATAKQLELQKAKAARPTRTRFNFVYRGDLGWVYTIRSLDVANRQLKQVMFEREGAGLDYPGLVITADSASCRRLARRLAGAERSQPRDRRSRQASDVHLQHHAAPGADPIAGGPAGRGEGARRDALRGAGPLHRCAAPVGERRQQADGGAAAQAGDPGHLLHHRHLRRAAGGHHSRAGAAVGIAISLGTTVLFLLLTQITKAVGRGRRGGSDRSGVVAEYASLPSRRSGSSCG